MSDQRIIFSPEQNQWTLTDGRHYMEVPDWAREIMRDEFERETRPLQAEADRLREELADVPKCEVCEAMLDCDECLRADSSQKERRQLETENARLRKELESVGTAAYLYGRSDLKAENTNLRERITTQKQTIQAYRDESREWREVAERAQAEADGLREERDTYRDLVGYMVHPDIPDQLAADNAKLRELVLNCHGWLAVNCDKGYVIPRNGLDAIEKSMRELGVEVDG